MKLDAKIIALIVVAIILLLVFLYIGGMFSCQVHTNYIKTVSKLPAEFQKLLVVPNFNPAGGLHWMLYCIMAASHMARKYNLKLVVCYDSGLYFENRPEFLKQHSDVIDPKYNEWFSYYFEPIGIRDPYVYALWKQGKLPNDLPSMSQYHKQKKRSDVLGWKFDRDAFDAREHDVDYNREWRENMVLRPYLQQQLVQFAKDKFNYIDSGQKQIYISNNPVPYVIGAHIRGTDKYGNAQDNEDGPKHFKYEDYCQELALAPEKWRKKLKWDANRIIYVFVCSDEQPFIDFAEKYLSDQGINVVSTGDLVFRSPISTSGLDLKSHLCGGPLGDSHPDCKIYRDLANASVHRGFQDQSKYKKGWDAVFEVSVLSRYCQVFYKSRGNFSSSVGKSNKNIIEIDWVDYLTSKH